MPTTPTVNTQQVLQMGSHTEKLQHTLQNLPNVTAQQVNKERKLEDELKQTQVQNMVPAHLVDETDSHSQAKKRIRVRKKKESSENEKETPEPPLPEDPYRGKINIIA